MKYSLLKQKALDKLHDKTRQKARKMSKAGMSLRDIGSVLGCSYEQVRILLIHRNPSKTIDKVSK
mgnify:CR=1 FL=1